jgi:hypothetical protein
MEAGAGSNVSANVRHGAARHRDGRKRCAANAARTLERFAGLMPLRRNARARNFETFLSETIDGIRTGEFQRRSRQLEHHAQLDVLAEACLKLTWVEGEHGDGLPCVAIVRRFRSSGRGHDLFTFASEPLEGSYINEARLMSAIDKVRMTTTRTVSFRAQVGRTFFNRQFLPTTIRR